MGTLRKVGAFLGLVPDDARQYDDDLDYREDDAYDGDGPDVDRGYRSDRYQPLQADGHRSRYHAAEFGDETGGSVEQRHAGSHLVGAGAGQSVGRSGMAVATGSHPVADAGFSRRPAEHQDTGRSARLGGAHGGSQTESTDYRTQGALAYQPQPALRVESAADGSVAGHKPATVKLAGFADAREVGETYRVGQAVILDMTELSDVEARRMVDFAAGLAFAVHGSIDKVTTKVFMLHPPAADSSDAAVSAYAGR